SYVMENILFKISYPAEFHGQTAVECALKLHPKVKNNLENIKSMKLITQESGFRIINKIGPLHNPADRDHCLQYMVAVALIDGKLTANSYSHEAAKNPLIDKLREKMQVEESSTFSQDYLDPAKRSIANRIEIQYGDQILVEEIHYPIGHRFRREEGIPLLLQKFNENLHAYYSSNKAQFLYEQCTHKSLFSLTVDKFIELWML
ncbi:MAG TPA: 2-methylcitrate dehydratase, partial [Gammaproteobacteria bacterium]|nr:2-methylcitrate dehydratase [Gammaproteobacteria bacterium]